MFYKPAALFDALVKSLVAEKGELMVSAWFDSTVPVVIKDGFFVMQNDNPIVRDTLEKHFTENAARILGDLFGEGLSPLYVCGENEALKWRLNEEASIFDSYTFDRFIVGNSNKFAYAASQAVSNKPAGAYNPLFIYGGSGLGKTHLLYSIAGEIRKNLPGYNIVYVKGDDFTNQLVASIASSQMNEFRQKYRDADLLLVDDIQFIAGKERTQEEFFHTFNALHEAGRQLVLTSDRAPREILTLEERLRTRFEWGLLADVQSPDEATRMAIILSKASLLGISIPNDIVEFIATAITSNVRELEGVVKKVAALHLLMGQPIDKQLAQDAIKDIFKENPGLNPTPQMIIKEVALYFSMPPERLLSVSRARDVVVPRQVACYLIRELSGLSLTEIGKIFDQHHTTVLHNLQKLDRELPEKSELKNAISDMRQNITGQR